MHSNEEASDAVLLRDALRGQSIGLTGVTGFVGEALLQRVLTDLPDTLAVALVRPKGSNTAIDRIDQLLRKETFAAARAPYGGDAAALRDARVTVIEGDLGSLPDLPAELDVLVHCAGDVSFDPSIEEAFTTNVLGTQALVEKVLAASAGRPGRAHPCHYVHVSTAYVSGRRRGAIAEGPVRHDVDWRTEARWGMAARAHFEAASRMPARLTQFRAQAEREHGKAGPLTAAADAERRRHDWLTGKLVEAGGERGRSLGWTDCYTFTKAMGERVVEELGDELACSIVRPSIIESSLVDPFPGWIEGFKMAEPLIMAYGRGELPEFPASPDSIVDIVPCDQVVNAILGACATAPPPGEPAYYHVSSGSRNPLNFAELYGFVRDYFLEHPFATTDRGSVRLPEWQFPGADAVERFLSSSERMQALASRALSYAPRGRRVRKMVDDLDRSKRRVDGLRRYLDLYRPYTQTEMRFLDENTLALYRALDPADADEFGFDTATIDWRHYLMDVHFPSVTKPIRTLDAARARRGRAQAPQMRLPAPAPDVLAVFDLDGTLLTTNVLETYAWLRMPELGANARLRELGSLLRKLPGYVRAERTDRGGFLRAVYRRYAGADASTLDRIVDETLTPHILASLSPDALRRVRAHRAAGHRTVLITGAVRPFTRPLASLFDDIVAADLDVGPDGRCTGYLTSPPLVGESRAAWLAWYAGQHGFDLTRSFAYADSHADLPMLSAVGNPVAVSPDVHLQRLARANRWPIEDWATGTGLSRLRIPSVDDAEQAALVGAQAATVPDRNDQLGTDQHRNEEH